MIRAWRKESLTRAVQTVSVEYLWCVETSNSALFVFLRGRRFYTRNKIAVIGTMWSTLKFFDLIPYWHPSCGRHLA
jgi:hypothetical protein